MIDGRRTLVESASTIDASLARPTTPGHTGSGPREVCADYDAIGHVLLAVLHQARSGLAYRRGCPQRPS